MTDDKLIKALECCGIECKCSGCPLDDSEFVSNCIDGLCKNALDLINHQKAEIERLEKEVKDKERAYNDELCWRKEWQTKCREVLKEKQTIKSDAIKEFAEKFVKTLSEFDMSSVGLPDYDRGYKDCMTAIEDTIDNLVK